jgi:hypothetical protein
MKARLVLRTKSAMVALCVAVLLAALSGCTNYNPYNGQREFAPGKTMAAVGTAAYVGSVVDTHHYRHEYYNRPSYHHHYHHRR